MIRFDETLWLFTPEEFEQLPNGTTLRSINTSSPLIKGKYEFNMDTRFGHIAYGVDNPNNHPLAELFITFRLKE